jgi:ABC-type sugar transport system, permease component
MKLFVKILKNIAVWLISLTVIIPLLLIVFNALKNDMDASTMSFSIAPYIKWDNFSTVIEQGKLIISFFNSVLYSVVSVALCALFSTMAAYVLYRRKDGLSKGLYFFISLGIAMPVNYVSLTWVMQATHLNNTQFGICLLYAAMWIPFSVFLAYGFIGSVPKQLDEAGIIDGCSPLRLFFSIILPLLKPIIVTIAVLNFMNAWNEFISPLYFLNNSDQWPMTLAVYNFFGQFQMSWNLVCADILLTSLPVFIIYLFGQRFIISGMTAGAVKG